VLLCRSLLDEQPAACAAAAQAQVLLRLRGLWGAHTGLLLLLLLLLL
jgi:hypothetical protein